MDGWGLGYGEAGRAEGDGTQLRPALTRSHETRNGAIRKDMHNLVEPAGASVSLPASCGVSRWLAGVTNANQPHEGEAGESTHAHRSSGHFEPGTVSNPTLTGTALICSWPRTSWLFVVASIPSVFFCRKYLTHGTASPDGQSSSVLAALVLWKRTLFLWPPIDKHAGRDRGPGDPGAGGPHASAYEAIRRRHL